jgi:ABC-type long-subunit fatty acid transport system fused permease/ATPase subunit
MLKGLFIFQMTLGIYYQITCGAVFGQVVSNNKFLVTNLPLILEWLLVSIDSSQQAKASIDQRAGLLAITSKAGVFESSRSKKANP